MKPSKQSRRDCRARNKTNQIAAGQVLVVGAGYPAPAFAAQHWDGAEEEEEDAPWAGGKAGELGTWDEGRPSRARRKSWVAHGGWPSQA